MRLGTQRVFSRAGKVFTVVDGAMTSGFGFIAISATIFKPVIAIALGLCSMVLAVLPVAALYLWQASDQPRYRWLQYAAFGLVALYLGGFVANFVSNFGMTSALLKGEVVAARNANTIVGDLAHRIKRTRAEINKLGKRIDMAPAKLAPEAYDREIERWKATSDRGQSIWKRTKGCAPGEVTLPVSQKICQAIASAAANKTNAVQRLEWVAERKQLRKELARLEGERKETPETVSVAASQAEYIAKVLTGSLTPDQDTMDWTIVGVGIVIALMVSFMAHTCNFIAALNLAGEVEHEAVHHKRVTADSSRDTVSEPAPLRPQPVEATVARTLDEAAHVHQSMQPQTINVIAADDDLGQKMSELAAKIRRMKPSTQAA